MLTPTPPLAGSISSYFSRLSHHNYAFCSSSFHDTTSQFPLPSPNKYLPWIWDAILSMEFVEIIAISRNACKFNQKQWHELIELYPQYKSELANGTTDNILIDVDDTFDYVKKNVFEPDQGSSIIGATFQCIYLDHYGEEVADTVSEVVQGSIHSDLSSLLIRCPLPPISLRNQWKKMRLDRYRFVEANIVDVLSTEEFPVCGHDNPVTPFLQKKTGVQQIIPEYNLTICTATSRHKPIENLIEWIEYHRLLGVEHFFIYDTSLPPQKQSLQDLLSGYIADGLVTVILWPYENCVHGMASGRWVGYHMYSSLDGTPIDTIPENLRSIHSSLKSEFRFFFPPRAISHTAALASCYSRYRRSTRWMAHIDDDEYLAFNKSSSTSINSLKSLLVNFLSQNQSLTALAFHPLFVTPCSTGLSRLRSWGYHARLGADHEVKLILRTSAVRMFFVHYITEWELEKDEGIIKEGHEPLVVPLSVGALLHYRDESLSIFGRILGKFEDTSQGDRCNENGVIGYRNIENYLDTELLRIVSDSVNFRLGTLNP